MSKYIAKRGKLICIDGMDAAGKTTQTNLLTEWLDCETGNAMHISFPVYSTPIGDIIHRGLHDQLPKYYTKEIQCLLMTANRYEMLPTIQHALDCGRHVILNRYFPSNLVYGTASGVDLLWLEQIDSHLPKPDITIILLTKVSTINKRRSKDKQDVFESDKKYLKIVSQIWEAASFANHWIMLDADRSIDEIHKDIVDLVKPVLNQS